MGLHSYVCSQYGDDMVWLAEIITAKCLTKVSFEINAYQLWLDWERDGLYQVYLPNTCCVYLKTCRDFNPDTWKELVGCSSAQ